MVAAMGGIISQPDIAEMRTEVMQVPVPMVPMIMGRGAEHVKKIQEVYGVNIQVEKDNNSNRGSAMRDVTIRGREEMVAKAKEVIQTMVQTGHADVARWIRDDSDREGPCGTHRGNARSDDSGSTEANGNDDPGRSRGRCGASGYAQHCDHGTS